MNIEWNKVFCFLASCKELIFKAIRECGRVGGSGFYGMRQPTGTQLQDKMSTKSKLRTAYHGSNTLEIGETKFPFFFFYFFTAVDIHYTRINCQLFYLHHATTSHFSNKVFNITAKSRPRIEESQSTHSKIGHYNKGKGSKTECHSLFSLINLKKLVHFC